MVANAIRERQEWRLTGGRAGWWEVGSENHGPGWRRGGGEKGRGRRFHGRSAYCTHRAALPLLCPGGLTSSVLP